MKQTTISFVSVCIVLLAATGNTGAAPFAGGTGEPNDPYRIATAEQLISIGSDPNLLDKHFILTADIDLDPNLPGNRVFDRAVIAPDVKLVMDRYMYGGHGFTGDFDGRGHVITGLVIDSNSLCVGLFGMVGKDGHVSNLHLVDGSVQGKARNHGNHGIDGFTGVLAAINKGEIISCSSTGFTLTGGYVGGLVGFNDTGTISACSSMCWIKGALADCGGLVGRGGGGSISACLSTGSVSGAGNVGGLMGSNHSGTVSTSYSASSANGSTAGGLVGDNSAGFIQGCYSTGSVTAGAAAGGLVGWNNGGVLSACHSTGPVQCTDGCAGGLVGSNTGSIWTSYSAGSVTTTRGKCGGLVGSNSARGDTISRSFWDVQTSGQTQSEGGTGKTTAQMQTARTFLDAWWDFVDETTNGTNDTWKIVEGKGYPHLAWETVKYSGGTGEPGDEYQIGTAADLIDLGKEHSDYGSHFILIADIDLDPNLPGNRIFDRAVIAPEANDASIGVVQRPAFRGVFDGRGHAITGLVIDSNAPCVGLFGIIDYGARVSNLRLVGGSVHGQDPSLGRDNWVRYTGALAGANKGLITACSSTASVSGSDHAGGLVGYNWRGTISACHCAGSVYAGRDSGGLVGYDYGGTILACRSTGPVSCKDWGAGGLVGSTAFGTIFSCYSTGAVGGTPWDAGGLIAYNDRGTISACYSTGQVSGRVGGTTGGLVSANLGTVYACFWNVETSGQSVSSGGTGLTTPEMRRGKTFVDAGWDFVGETANGTADLWWIDEGRDYPRLWWETRD